MVVVRVGDLKFGDGRAMHEGWQRIMGNAVHDGAKIISAAVYACLFAATPCQPLSLQSCQLGSDGCFRRGAV